MPIACQCREVAAGPLLGYQVGGAQSGDGPSYIQQQQDPKFRALPCISIYVQSGQDNAATQKSAEGLPLKPTGAGAEALQALVAQDNQILSQASLQVLGLNSRGDDLGCTVEYDVKKLNSEEVHRKRIAEDPVERLDSLRDAVSSCSSSIGVDNCSSLSVEDDASGEMEVESKYKGPLDRMTELEDSLPVKRGLSNFYSGKSKSFACLSDVTSVKDLAKPENPYNKRRRNMLAYNGWDRSRFSSTRNGISKKGMHSSRSTLALAVVMSQSDDSQETDEQDDVPLPPLPLCQVRRHRTFTSPRSFSLTDLQGV